MASEGALEGPEVAEADAVRDIGNLKIPGGKKVHCLTDSKMVHPGGEPDSNLVMEEGREVILRKAVDLCGPSQRESIRRVLLGEVAHFPQSSVVLEGSLFDAFRLQHAVDR